LLAAWRQTGVMPQELADAPSQPEQLAYLWGFFLDLSRQRTNNGFGVLPLQYADIYAWTRLNEQPLDRWELDAILRLDGAYLASANKPKKVSDNVN